MMGKLTIFQALEVDALDCFVLCGTLIPISKAHQVPIISRLLLNFNQSRLMLRSYDDWLDANRVLINLVHIVFAN